MIPIASSKAEYGDVPPRTHGSKIHKWVTKHGLQFSEIFVFSASEWFEYLLRLPISRRFPMMVCTLSPVLIPFSKVVPYGIPLADERQAK